MNIIASGFQSDIEMIRLTDNIVISSCDPGCGPSDDTIEFVVQQGGKYLGTISEAKFREIIREEVEKVLQEGN